MINFQLFFFMYYLFINNCLFLGPRLPFSLKATTIMWVVLLINTVAYYKKVFSLLEISGCIFVISRLTLKYIFTPGIFYFRIRKLCLRYLVRHLGTDNCWLIWLMIVDCWRTRHGRAMKTYWLYYCMSIYLGKVSEVNTR